jgi:U4/U6.U5 tri-snRNP-associated protein 2
LLRSLTTGFIFCLPDGYEIVDSSLDDISASLHPTFTLPEISELDTNTKLARDWFGRRYLPGFVGLNPLDKTDGINAMVQALAHVPPLRDYFLRQRHDDIYIPGAKQNPKKPAPKMSNLVLAFGELVRKLWSNRRLKHSVDPQRLVQEITIASSGKFGKRAEMGEQLAWFLHQLHIGLGGTSKRSSIIHDIFQGQVQVTTKAIRRKVVNSKTDGQDDDRLGSGGEESDKEDQMMNEQDETIVEETIVDMKFLQLTLDIPEKPLFKDDEGGLVIPQEPLVNVLRKFDGVTFSDTLQSSSRRYKLKSLPPYLILHLQRFTTNSYTREKNPTIVIFPVKNFDLSPYVSSPDKKRNVPPTLEELQQMDVTQLKKVPIKYHQDHLAENVTERNELIQIVSDFCSKSLPDLLADKYDLVANITHDSNDNKIGDPLQEGTYKCHVQHRGQWYEMQDLHVQETMPQLIGLSESYVLIFARKGAKLQLDSSQR